MDKKQLFAIKGPKTECFMTYWYIIKSYEYKGNFNSYSHFLVALTIAETLVILLWVIMKI